MSIDLLSADWKCPICGALEVDWTYGDLCGRGSPVCGECDADMEVVGDSGRVLTDLNSGATQ